MSLKHVLFILLMLFANSCQNITYQQELNNLLANNSKYSRQIEANGFRIKATYLPMRYFELRDLTSLDSLEITKERIQSIKQKCQKQYGNGLYFKVTLAKVDGKDIVYDQMNHFGQWSQRLKKLLFGLKEHIYLQTDQIKEIPLSVYDFQRSFGYTKDRSMLLVFPKLFNDINIMAENNIAMHFKDWGWNIGRQKLEWVTADLN